MKDYHIHSNFGDGKNSIDEMVKTSASLGFKEIALTEHYSPFFAKLNKLTGKKFHLYPGEVVEYYKQCEEAEQKHQIRVLKGFEITYLEFDEDNIKKEIEQHKPEIILLSVHHLEILEDIEQNGKVDKKGYSMYVGFNSFAQLILQYGSFEKVCESYFKRLQNAVNSNLIDYCPKVGIGHLNLFRQEPQYNSEKIKPFLDEIINSIIKRRLALEVNFHYFEKCNNEPRPCFKVARDFMKKGGKEVWFGSDSHKIEQIIKSGKYYPLFEQELKK